MVNRHLKSSRVAIWQENGWFGPKLGHNLLPNPLRGPVTALRSLKTFLQFFDEPNIAVVNRVAVFL